MLEERDEELTITVVRLESAPFISKYIDKEYLDQSGQRRIEEQLKNARMKRSTPHRSRFRGLAPLDLSTHMPSVESANLTGHWAEQ